MPETPNIIPPYRFRDAHAAIDFLVDAFGFGKLMVVPGPDDTVAQVQRRFGNGVIMLGTAAENALGLKGPDELGGTRQGTYV